MQIKIEHLISPVFIKIYEIEFNRVGYKHVGTYFSRRNDENDLWGHLWESTYEEKLDEELDELFEPLIDDGVHYEEIYSSEAYHKIVDKYNPIAHKTISGEPYFSGRHFGGNDDYVCSKYAIELSDDELRCRILEAITQILDRQAERERKNNEKQNQNA